MLGLRALRLRSYPLSLSDVVSRTNSFQVPSCVKFLVTRRVESPRRLSHTDVLAKPKAELETREIEQMDSLLKVVRERSNPAYRSTTPLRDTGLWAETLTRTATVAAKAPPLSAKPRTDALPERNMHDSYSQITLPFASSPKLLEQYTNAGGGIRLGKLMEHLDSLAGSVAYKHMLGPEVSMESFDAARVAERGFYIVTASVDRLDMLGKLNPIRDIRLSGHVIHAGSSSMEIVVKMEALEQDGSESTLMLGRFCMVCRDAVTNKAYPVCQLTIDTPEEKALFALGKEYKERRKAQGLVSLSRVPPSSEEAATLHSFFLKYGKNDPSDEGVERVWMESATLEKCQLMFPQSRNVHSKIFGGYLMRLAYELGFANSTLFNLHPQRFVSLDGISFKRPVEIGSVLSLNSQVMHTAIQNDGRVLTHLRVLADVLDVETGKRQNTDDFRFTFVSADKDDFRMGFQPSRPEKKMRLVVPRTYSDSMLWLEGKRALEMGAEIRGLRSHV